jgi:transposase
LPHAIAITTAEVTDRSGALQTIDRCRPNLERVESLLVDGGYTGQPFADGVKQRLQATVQIVKRNELHTFAMLPKRWVVERSFGWLEKCRRLWKNCERKLNTSLQFVLLAFLILLLRRSCTGSSKNYCSSQPAFLILIKRITSLNFTASPDDYYAFQMSFISLRPGIPALWHGSGWKYPGAG